MNPPVTIDGNEAAVMVAYQLNDVIAIYPITPVSPMAELADAWAATGKTNLWGNVPVIQQMQSEGGAAGTIHGALQTGAMTTTFTASQGLLLMIPNMYKIAGELTSTVFHVAARSLATQGLSIFCDHSDVMATRSTGWAMLFACSVQEAMDFALIAQISTLEARIPFLNVFDGFRTSHEIQKITPLSQSDLRVLIDDHLVHAHRRRGLTPDHPLMRGTAQNPDVYFQARETVNPYYLAAPSIVQQAMDRFAEQTGRAYHLFDYVGAADAERVVILMGSGCETVEETVKALNQRGERVGMVKIRLFRPFSAESLVTVLPATVRAISVLDRTKEPGSLGEPLYMDVVTALSEQWAGHSPLGLPRVLGGRYGLGSKEFTPAMAEGVFSELGQQHPKNHFTIGIQDDVTGSSLPYKSGWDLEASDTVRAMFWGLGSDGTVSANKNAIKIIGEETPNYVQGYFVYDSRKSGSVTISHLRFGPRPIHSPYLLQRANFVAVSQFDFLEKYPVLERADEGALFLLNSPYGPEEIWNHVPLSVQEQIVNKKMTFYVIDGTSVAQRTGMGNRINTIMQTCFFALSGVLPRDDAMARIKQSIRKSYGKRGEAIVRQNEEAVDRTLENLHQVSIPGGVMNGYDLPDLIPAGAPDFVRTVTGPMIAGRGDALPVSALPTDGTYPTGTTKWEKRNIALEAPIWEPDLCIQCGKCVLVCPHSVIRAKVCTPDALAAAPQGFQSAKARWREAPDRLYTLQIGVEDCTGCTLCVEVCPVRDKSMAKRKAINMSPQRPQREQGRINWAYFLSLDSEKGHAFEAHTVKNVQTLQPLFEYSGACAGCGETPYLKLLSQLFGDHAVIANATGCSSIYGGNLPTTPWTVNAQGYGPAWSNSLFEDNAEFGLGMRLSLDLQATHARRLLLDMADKVGAELVGSLLNADQATASGIQEQRDRVTTLRSRLSDDSDPRVRDLQALADHLVRKSVWIVGGDGWAYDIGFGGLDHVLASGANVNILVLDTEVYSNTGGQSSKATPKGAVAKFAARGKDRPKKDLAQMAMTYRDVYVATVAMGADDAQTVQAFVEAEAYQGPSLIIAYSHCIAHGIDLARGMSQQRRMVDSGRWTLFRYNPELAASGTQPFLLDSRPPKIRLKDEVYQETRYQLLLHSQPDRAEKLLSEAQDEATRRFKAYEAVAESGNEETE